MIAFQILPFLMLTASAVAASATTGVLDPDVRPGDLEVSDPSDLGDLSAAAGQDATPAAGRRRKAVPIENDDTQPKHVLPTNKQVSAFLRGGRYKRFLYRQNKDGSPISLVVTPCSAELVGVITFYPDSVREGGKSALVVRRVTGPDQVIYTERRGEPGSYDINITALADTYVHFLAADEDLAGLSSLQTKVKVRNRSKNRADISWAPGAYGGLALQYCLITSPQRHFSTVCGALSAKFGLQPPEYVSARRRRQQVAPPLRRRLRPERDGNITVGCVGRDTVYTLYDLMPGPHYHVTVFGQYLNRNVSFRYGTAEFQYEDRSRTSVTVRPNKMVSLDLSLGRPSRRLALKPSRRGGGVLHYYVTSCGGPLTLRVLRGRHRPVQIQEATVSAVGLFAGRLNASRAWYQFEVTAPGRDTSVEFQATWRRRRLRLPTLPDRPVVRHVSERRRRKLQLGCGQIALSLPRAQGRRPEYCVLLEPDRCGRLGRRFKPPSVCGLDLRVERSPANRTVCGPSKKLRRGKRIEVVFRDLEPNRTYIVRAMVRPKGGRFLPYNLRQITVPPCPDQLPNELTETIAGKEDPFDGCRTRERVKTLSPGAEFGSLASPISDLEELQAEKASEKVEEAENRLFDQP